MIAEYRRRILWADRQADRLAARTATDYAPLHFADWCPAVLRHYFPGKGADFHGPLLDRLDSMHLARGTRDATIAPRGGSKSTIETLAYPLRCAVEGIESHTIILSDSATQANELLAHIRRELEDNPELEKRYPNATGRGSVWRDNRLRLRNGAVIEAMGRGSRIRGRRNRQDRPSLIILDDVQSNRDVVSPTLRTHAWSWVVNEVIPSGDLRTNFLSVGSALHSDAVAVQIGKLPGWRSWNHQAVHRWPDRLDLWAECERLATNQADPDRATVARAYYEDRRAEMDAGHSIYWPEKWPLYDLMMRRAEIGAAAFDSEYQGVPNLGGLAVWTPELWDDAPGKPLWFDQWPEDAQWAFRVLALDFSRGGLDGDPQALAEVGCTRGGDFWLDCDVDRLDPSAMVAKTIKRARERLPDKVVVEDNSTLGLLQAEFETQLAGKPLPCDVEYLTNTDKKEDRILDAIGKYLVRRRVRVRRTRGGQTLAEQGRSFPHCTNDDALDATATGIRRVEERLLRGR